MPCVAIEEVVLTAVRLIGHHDHVPTIGEHRMGVALLVGGELLQRRENNAATPPVEQLAH